MSKKQIEPKQTHNALEGLAGFLKRDRDRIDGLHFPAMDEPCLEEAEGHLSRIRAVLELKPIMGDIGEALEGLEAIIKTRVPLGQDTKLAKAHLATVRAVLEFKPITGEIGEDLHGLKERLYWLRDAAKDHAPTGEHRVEIEFETALDRYQAVREWVGRVKAAIPLDGKIIREQKAEIARLREIRKANEGTIQALKNIGSRARNRADTYRGALEEAREGLLRLSHHAGSTHMPTSAEQQDLDFAVKLVEKIDAAFSPPSPEEPVCETCGGSEELSMESPLYTEECPDCEGTGDETDGT